MSRIIVYADRGVDAASLQNMLETLSEEVDLSSHSLICMDAQSVTMTSWEKDTALFVIPGGRDIYYHSALSGKGTEKIRRFVEDGGNYLGVCAGAYFASSFIEFDKGGDLEICGKRHLEFFPGRAIGPAYAHKKYSYEDHTRYRGAEAALISWRGQEIFSYFNGGCRFDDEEFAHIEVLGRYEHLESRPPAIVSCGIAKGKAILSGVHLEFSVSSLAKIDLNSGRIASQLKMTDHFRRDCFREILEKLSVQLKK